LAIYARPCAAANYLISAHNEFITQSNVDLNIINPAA